MSTATAQVVPDTIKIFSTQKGEIHDLIRQWILSALPRGSFTIRFFCDSLMPDVWRWTIRLLTNHQMVTGIIVVGPTTPLGDGTQVRALVQELAAAALARGDAAAKLSSESTWLANPEAFTGAVMSLLVHAVSDKDGYDITVNRVGGPWWIQLRRGDENICFTVPLGVPFEDPGHFQGLARTYAGALRERIAAKEAKPAPASITDTFRQFLADRDKVWRETGKVLADDWVESFGKLRNQVFNWVTRESDGRQAKTEYFIVHDNHAVTGPVKIGALSIQIAEKVVTLHPDVRMWNCVFPNGARCEGGAQLRCGGRKYFLGREIKKDGSDAWWIGKHTAEVKPLTKESLFEAIMEVMS